MACRATGRRRRRILTEPVDGAVAVDREYLLEAVEAGGDGQITLALDGPLNPLVIRTSSGLSLLMRDPEA